MAACSGLGIANQPGGDASLPTDEDFNGSERPALPWTGFAVPQSLQQGGFLQVTTVPLSDWRLQLFIVGPKTKFWTTVKNGACLGRVAGRPWTQFVTTGVPAGGVFYLAGARMLDGSVNLWALTTEGLVWSISRSASSTSAEYSLANAGWGVWAQFKLFGGRETVPLTNAKGIFAGNRGRV